MFILAFPAFNTLHLMDTRDHVPDRQGQADPMYLL
jgi:hypothetical protein